MKNVNLEEMIKVELVKNKGQVAAARANVINNVMTMLDSYLYDSLWQEALAWCKENNVEVGSEKEVEHDEPEMGTPA